MKIKVTENVQVEKEVEVELPYYYEHDLSDLYEPNSIYGKIVSEDKKFTIHERENSDGFMSYEIEEEDSDGSYFKPEHKSTQKAFESAKQRAVEFLNKF